MSRSSERGEQVTQEQVYGYVFAEVAAWQESHWRAQHDEGRYAQAIAGQLGHVATGLTRAERYQAIGRAVERHMDDVTRGNPQPGERMAVWYAHVPLSQANWAKLPVPAGSECRHTFYVTAFECRHNRGVIVRMAEDGTNYGNVTS